MLKPQIMRLINIIKKGGLGFFVLIFAINSCSGASWNLKNTTMKKNIMILAAIACITTLAFYSCSKDKNEENTTLHVRLTDAPTAFDEVNVDIREVKIKFSDDLNRGDIYN